MGVGYANISTAIPWQMTKSRPTKCRCACPAGSAGTFPKSGAPCP